MSKEQKKNSVRST